MTIGKTFHFDAAHSLPWHKGACSNLHGHTWKVTVEVTGEVSSANGIVMDYSDLKSLVEPLLAQLDHSNLNELMPNPTCENLTSCLIRRLWSSLPAHIVKLRVQIQEGEGGYAYEERER
ncbi:MAG: 6-carboxy-5,6,7,8-tetrahydropterin synthase [Actinobacteria bacterium]|nr:6-carboxy-5,6,7,8-tetrahydropterin synthase [Actinomycetota bacterium]